MGTSAFGIAIGAAADRAKSDCCGGFMLAVAWQDARGRPRTLPFYVRSEDHDERNHIPDSLPARPCSQQTPQQADLTRMQHLVLRTPHVALQPRVEQPVRLVLRQVEFGISHLR